MCDTNINYELSAGHEQSWEHTVVLVIESTAAIILSHGNPYTKEKKTKETKCLYAHTSAVFCKLTDVYPIFNRDDKQAKFRIPRVYVDRP